jgi:hypothetical protein
MTNDSNKKHFKNIGIVGQANWRFFVPDLVRNLIRKYDANVHLYAASELHAEFYRNSDSEGLFSSVQVIRSEIPPSLPIIEDSADVIDCATAIEKKYNRTIASLTVTNRHLGRGYALGGFHHPRSFLSEDSTHVQAVKITIDLIEFWENEFINKNISMMINLRSDIGVTVANYYNVPVRNIYESRYKSFNNWAVDGMLTNPLIKKAFDDVEPSSIELLPQGVAAPPTGHAVARNKLMHQFSLPGMVKSSLKMAKEQLYNAYKGNRSGSYYLTSKFAMNYRIRQDAKRLTNGSYPWLKDLGDQPFIFFPLHVEPEASLQGQSPEYLSQLNAIVSLSRSLPAKYLLVVKEHLGGVGRRPRDFYGQIMDLKNVVLMDLRELGKDVVQKSALVATISGTAGLEAAVAGKPVITFGRHNSYNILPHVRVISNESQIKTAFDELLSEAYDQKTATINGARYLKAVENASFNLENYNHFTGRGYEEKEVLECLDKLEKSLSEIDSAMIENALAGYPN